MPLNKEQKGVALSEVTKLFETSKVVVLTDYKGIKVEDVTALRRQVREAKGRFKVVKNTLSRKVFADAKYESFRKLLKGSSALAFGQEDPIELVKKITEFTKTNKQLTVRGGLMDGQVLSLEQLTVLATLPARPVLMAQILGWFNSPISQLMGTMNAQISNFLSVLKQIEEKQAGAAPGAAAS
jgi:large subunit ribosomal protein L10